MKKLLSFSFACFLLFACTNNKQAVRSRNLQGRYDVDFSSLLYSDSTDALADAFASVLFSTVKMTIQFEETKMIVDASGMAKELVNLFADEYTKMPVIAEYKIKNDSVLCIKDDSGEFKSVAVISRLSDSYDYLNLKVKDSDKQYTFVLRKQKEDN